MAAASPARRRLEVVLRDTSENDRQVANLELPRALNFFVTPERVATLRPAAVLIAVVDDEAGPSIILTRRSDGLRAHAGQVSLPGGARETQDATLRATALREAREEIGLAPERVEVLGYLDDYPTSSRYRVTPVVGWVEGAFQPQAEALEVAEVFRVPLAVVLDASHYRRASFVRRGLQWPFFQFDHDGHHVWGATAGMLLNLCRKVASSHDQ